MYGRGLGAIALVCSVGCGGPAAQGPRHEQGYEPPSWELAGHAQGARGGEEPTLPDPARGEPVELDTLLAWAHRHSPEVRVAEAELARARAAREAAEPLLPSNPELGGGAGPRITANGTGVDYEASLSQSFEIAGERGLRFEVAERVDERLHIQLHGAHWRVHSHVHAGYHTALVQRERVEAAARLLEFQEQLLEISERRVAAGDASPLVVRLTEGQVAQARQGLIAARQRYEAARLGLAEVAGWPVAHPPEPQGSTEQPHELPPMATLMEKLAAHQPALAEARARVEEARARLSLEDREVWPEPSLGVSWHREGGPNESEDLVFGTVTLPIPLWQRNQGARAEARAELEIAEAELAALEQRLAAQLARASSAVEAAGERVAVYGTEILPSFERNLEMLQRAFELGEIDVLDVSVAVERFLRTRTEALDAQADYFEALAELEEIVGTDLWPEEDHGLHDQEAHTAPVEIAPARDPGTGADSDAEAMSAEEVEP